MTDAELILANGILAENAKLRGELEESVRIRKAAEAANKAEFDGHKLTVADHKRALSALQTAREALEHVGFVAMEHGEQPHCPVCRRWRSYGHDETCSTKNAITAIDAVVLEPKK